MTISLHPIKELVYSNNATLSLDNPIIRGVFEFYEFYIDPTAIGYKVDVEMMWKIKWTLNQRRCDIGTLRIIDSLLFDAKKKGKGYIYFYLIGAEDGIQ